MKTENILFVKDKIKRIKYSRLSRIEKKFFDIKYNDDSLEYYNVRAESDKGVFMQPSILYHDKNEFNIFIKDSSENIKISEDDAMIIIKEQLFDYGIKYH